MTDNEASGSGCKSLDCMLKQLDMQNAPGSWLKYYEAAMSSFPEGIPGFLEDGFIIDANRLLKLKAEVVDAFLAALPVIRSHPGLVRLAWLWRHIIYVVRDPLSESVSTWPVPEHAMGSLASMFPAIVAISELPIIERVYMERGIPCVILTETLLDVGNCIDFYRSQFGVWGVNPRYMNWLRYHFTGRTFRLRRFNFRIGTFHSSIRVYRNMESGETIALAGDSMKFRKNGLIDGTNGIFDGEESWAAQMNEDDGFIEGSVISPDGRAYIGKLCLDKREWDLTLSAGDTIIEVHIPDGSRLEQGLCLESYKAALEFFPKYFKNKSFKAFTCESWLLDPQLRPLLPTESNIVSFQRDFCLYPVLSDDSSIYENVFGGRIPADASSLPTDTSLRRNIRSFMIDGGHLQEGGGFILI